MKNKYNKKTTYKEIVWILGILGGLSCGIFAKISVIITIIHH